MTGEQAKRAFERSSPYVSWANLVVLAGLIFTGVQAGVIDFGAGSGPVVPVGEIKASVSRNKTSIDQLRRADERQDHDLQSTERWVGQRMQRLEQKVDRIYELLIERGNGPSGRRGPS